MSIIGVVTAYTGALFPELHGQSVQICAVIRSMRVPGLPDEERCFIPNNAMLEALGGIALRDRLEIVRVRADGRLCVIYYECDPDELECFVRLRAEVDALVAGLPETAPMA